MRVAIQGEPGSNSDLATRHLLGDVDLLPCHFSAEVFEKLSKNREADAAILPIENSLHGAVADHSDLLLEHGVSVIAELSLRIRHTLMAAPGTERKNVTRVLSHPVALSQCRRFFRENPTMQAVPFYDTAGAVKYLLDSNEPDAAAIAAPYAAEVYGAQILMRELEDDPLNFTRFFLLVRPEDKEELRPTPAIINKLSVAFELAHRPGSLRDALTLLAAEGADLTRIESRPVPGKPWEYTFFVDLRFPQTTSADAILRTLRQTGGSVTELGRYAASPAIA